MRSFDIAWHSLVLLGASAFAIAGVYILVTADSRTDVMLALGALSFFGSAIPFFAMKIWTDVTRGRDEVADTAGAPRVFRSSIGQVAALAFMMVGFGGGGAYFLLTTTDLTAMARVFCWIVVGACLIGAPAIMFKAAFRPVSLTLSRAGLNHTPFKIGLIEWQDIAAVSSGVFFRSEIVTIELRDPEKYYARGFVRGRGGRWLASKLRSPFMVMPEQLGATSQAIIDAINLRLAAFGDGSVPRPGSPGFATDTNPAVERMR